MVIKLPRWTKKSPILATQLNQLAEAIERASAFEVDGSTGLQLNDSATARTLSLVRGRGAMNAIVHAILPAMSGSQMYKGSIDLQYKDDNDKLQPYGGDPEDCYNGTTTPIAAGSQVAVEWVEDSYWQVFVAPCQT